jgi:lysophospholipase L1-like esterase
MVITDGERSKIDEIEVFDITHGDYDTWFFAGTSISQMTFKDLIQEKNFAHFINEWNSDYTPAFIRGGIGCITLAGMRNDIKKYIEYGGSVKHFCIEIGTNDAWGGSNSGAKNFGIRLQRVIDSCVYYGIQPIIARTLATNEAKAGWQVHEDYLTVIDSLTTANNLHPGPDFYGYFIDHPEELANDGVHPNTTGAGSIQRLWAECVEPIYAQTTIEKQRQGKLPDNTQPMIYALSTSGGIIRFSAMHEGIVSIFTVGGKEIVRKSCGIGLNTLRTLPHGCYILRYTGNNTATTIHPFIATDRS